YSTRACWLSPLSLHDALPISVGESNATVHISVPDVYTGRLGVIYGVLPEQGLSVSLGGRVDGIPYHDIIGKSDGFRRPSYIVFVDPGIALERGPSTFTISTPVRVASRLATQAMAKQSSGTIGAGDLAGVLIF